MQTKNEINELGNNFPQHPSSRLLRLEEYLNETQLAEHWQVSKKLIQKMRYNGSGPRFVKIGHLVRYARNEIIKFEQSNLRNNTTKTNIQSGGCHE